MVASPFIVIHCLGYHQAAMLPLRGRPLIWTGVMASSNGNISRVTGPLWGESTGDRWIPFTKPVTRSCDVFFDLRLNKRLSKHLRRWWYETPSRSLWRHGDGFLRRLMLMPYTMITSWQGNSFRIHDRAFCEGNPPVTVGIPSQRASHEELWCFLWC